MKSTNGKFVSRNERIFFNGSMIVAGIIVSIITLYPLFYVLIASVSKPIFFVENGDVMFWVKGFTLASYKAAFLKDGIWIAYGNTIFFIQ